MLDIRTIRSERNGFRVDVFRRYKHENPATQKAKYTYKQLGSFLLTEGYASDLIEQLQPEEMIQLQNWLAEVRFAESLGTSLDELQRINLYAPPKLLEAMARLHTEAKRLGLEFIPHQVALKSLVAKARAMQQQIDEKNGFPCGILENAGIPAATDASEDEDTAADPESHALFQALLDLKQPLGKTCSELEAAAAHLGKTKKIPPPQVREWAGAMRQRNPHKRIKKWCFALAIEVLRQQGINPIQLMSTDRVAGYWAIQQQKTRSFLDALTTFIQIFSVPPEQHAAAAAAIAKAYARDHASPRKRAMAE